MRDDLFPNFMVLSYANSKNYKAKRNDKRANCVVLIFHFYKMHNIMVYHCNFLKMTADAHSFVFVYDFCVVNSNRRIKESIRKSRIIGKRKAIFPPSLLRELELLNARKSVITHY